MSKILAKLVTLAYCCVIIHLQYTNTDYNSRSYTTYNDHIRTITNSQVLSLTIFKLFSTI
uniref:Uncharacterized protein n=1 Tax=Myoviridae sp. ctFPV8 TaxID=2825068 RepID=A0A8S5PB41_9CAUD|nr:MAG TPA: hypothetical protein [Myoviridae sp. ctFPV8]